MPPLVSGNKCSPSWAQPSSSSQKPTLTTQAHPLITHCAHPLECHCPEGGGGADTHGTCSWSVPASRRRHQGRHRGQHRAPGQSTPRPCRACGTGRRCSLGSTARAGLARGTAQRACGTNMGVVGSAREGLLGCGLSPKGPRGRDVAGPTHVPRDPDPWGHLCALGWVSG